MIDTEYSLEKAREAFIRDGIREGIALEQANTVRKKARADAAEAEVALLRKQLAELQSKD